MVEQSQLKSDIGVLADVHDETAIQPQFVESIDAIATYLRSRKAACESTAELPSQFLF